LGCNNCWGNVRTAHLVETYCQVENLI
jgi:hypothetical protein